MTRRSKPPQYTNESEHLSSSPWPRGGDDASWDSGSWQAPDPWGTWQGSAWADSDWKTPAVTPSTADVPQAGTHSQGRGRGRGRSAAGNTQDMGRTLMVAARKAEALAAWGAPSDGVENASASSDTTTASARVDAVRGTGRGERELGRAEADNDRFTSQEVPRSRILESLRDDRTTKREAAPSSGVVDRSQAWWTAEASAGSALDKSQSWWVSEDTPWKQKSWGRSSHQRDWHGEAKDKSRDDSSWKLERLLGTWQDSKGSEYEVTTCSKTALTVRTVRPDGRALHTRALIRAEGGQVTWGKNTSFILESTYDALESSALWTSPSRKHKPFSWTRLAASHTVDVASNVEEDSAPITDLEEAWPSWEEVLELNELRETLAGIL